MTLLVGLICLALGVSLVLVWWSPAFVAALQVLAVVTLFVVGFFATMIGYSEVKAKRQFEDSVEKESKNNRPNSQNVEEVKADA
jgi:Na+/H+ antiporter NhaB